MNFLSIVGGSRTRWQGVRSVAMPPGGVSAVSAGQAPASASEAIDLEFTRDRQAQAAQTCLRCAAPRYEGERAEAPIDALVENDDQGRAYAVAACPR
jgi:hypothetical protein